MKAEDLILTLAECGIDFATGVPDSLQKDFCFAISSSASDIKHVPATNEGTAIGLALGYNIASGKTPLVYMQNSGLGNALNPLVSLAHPRVYQIPMLLMIGWRGQPGTQDEPQHMTQGSITQDLLGLLKIPYLIMESETKLFKVGEFLRTNLSMPTGPIALLVSNNTFENSASLMPRGASELMTREKAVQIITKFAPVDSIFVSTTGKLSRELNEIRERNQEVGRDFMTVGGMGHASSIALGMALSSSHNSFICLDGDGAALMHLGVMAMIGELKPRNFVHVILNNGTHESVGGQPIAAKIESFDSLAKSLNYESGCLLHSAEELMDYFENIDQVDKPCLVEVLINSESRSDLSRPSHSPIQNKDLFRSFLQNTNHDGR